VEASPSSVSAPPPTVADRKVEAAVKRDQVLGVGNVPTAQLEELARLLPLSEVKVEHQRFYSKVGPEGKVKPFDADRAERLMSGWEASDFEKRMQQKLRAMPLGGRTIVTIKSGEIEIDGEADCRVDENFCRGLGIAIAFGRAMKLVREQAGSPVGLAFDSPEGREAREAAVERPPGDRDRAAA
jgi:hypothetical protein